MAAPKTKPALETAVNEAYSSFVALVKSRKHDDLSAFRKIYGENLGEPSSPNITFVRAFFEKATADKDIFHIFQAYAIDQQARTGTVDFDPIVVAEAVFDVHDGLKKGAYLRLRTYYGISDFPDKVISYSYGEEYLADLKGRLVPIKQAYDTTLDAFITTLSLDRSVTGKEEKISAIASAFSLQFKIGIKESEDLMNSLLRAYNVQDEKNKPLFLVWLLESFETKADLVAVMKQAAPGNQYGAINSTFRQWKTENESRARKQLEEEQKLAKFPEHIRKGTLADFISEFERDTSALALERILDRKNFITTRLDMIRSTAVHETEIGKLGEELLELEAWFKSFNFAGATPATSTEEYMIALNSQLEQVQRAYNETSSDNLAAVELLKSAVANEKIFELRKKHLLMVDRRAGIIFAGIDETLTAGKFVKQVQERISSRMNTNDAAKGQNTWLAEYYNLAIGVMPLAATGAGKIEAVLSPQERMAVERTSTLSPLVATRFKEYSEAVAYNGVASPSEKKAVAVTLAKLYGIHPTVGPLLAAKYLSAITHIAEVARTNPNAFSRGLETILANVEYVTSAIYLAGTPSMITGSNTRGAVLALEAAFERLEQISEGSLSRYSRYNLWDSTLYVEPTPPFLLRHRVPGYFFEINPPEDLRSPFQPVYPLPYALQPVQSINAFTAGSLTANYQTGAGVVQLPYFNLALGWQTQADLVLQNVRAYLSPTHAVQAAPGYLPGTSISPLSDTRFLNEINRAFLGRERPDYSGELISGGMGAGLFGRTWEGLLPDVEQGGALGSFITRTGGYSFGGSKTETQTLAGFTAMAVPIGKASGVEYYVESAAGGFQKIEEQRGFVNERTAIMAAGKLYDPKNPSRVIFTLNQDITQMPGEEFKGFKRAKYYLIDLDSTVYELQGGSHDFVDMFNFLAGYADREGKEGGATAAFTVIPKAEAAGVAYAMDIGTTAMLIHFQEVPFLTSEGMPRERRPVFIEATLGGAVTVEKFGKVDVHSLVFRPKRLEIRTDQTTSVVTNLPEIVYALRRVAGRNDAMEVTAGLGVALTEEIRKTISGERELVDTSTGVRGGVFVKRELPLGRAAIGSIDVTSWGYGLQYEGGESALDLETRALLNEAMRIEEFVKATHRVGVTLYGSGQKANEYTTGVLMHALPQWLVTEKPIEEERERGTVFDTLFFRLIGFMDASEKVFGERITTKADIRRFQGRQGAILQQYRKLQTELSTADPVAARALIENFKKNNKKIAEDIFDKYDLLFQVNDDFSLDFGLVERERTKPEGIYDWAKKQDLELVTLRALLTWDRGFARAFASVPVLGTFGFQSMENNLGVIGVGAGRELPGIQLPELDFGGVNLLGGVLFQKAALDVGMLLSNESVELGRAAWKWPKSAWFAQAAVELFTNTVEDTNRFRDLQRRFTRSLEGLAKGDLTELRRPDESGLTIMDEIIPYLEANKIFDSTQISMLRTGTLSGMDSTQMMAVQSALFDWFEGEKSEINEHMNGNIRSYLVGSRYFLPDRLHWDVALIVEIQNWLKEYTIFAQRHEVEEGRKPLSLYEGIDLTVSEHLIVGALAGAEIRGGKEKGVGISARYSLPVGQLTSLFWRKTDMPPVYVYPAAKGARQFFAGRGEEWGIILTYTIGSGNPLQPIPTIGMEESALGRTVPYRTETTGGY